MIEDQIRGTYPLRDKGPLGRKAWSLREHLVQSMVHGVPITDTWLERFAAEMTVLCGQCDALENAEMPRHHRAVVRDFRLLSGGAE